MPDFVARQERDRARRLVRIDQPAERLLGRGLLQPAVLWRRDSSRMMRSSPGVFIQPRLSPLTRMRHGISAKAAFLVSVASAPFETL